MSEAENSAQDAPRKKKKQQRSGKMLDPLVHPCIKEHNMGLRCLNDNDFDDYKCLPYFENYKKCMKFWKKVQWDRSGKGITPFLPHPDDRAAAREKYTKMWAKK